MPKLVKSDIQEARVSRQPRLKGEQALRLALKRGGITECGAYRKLVEMWDTTIEKAIEGNLEAFKLVLDRLDGKPKQQIEANVNVNHAFEQALIAGRQRVLSHSVGNLPDNSKESERMAITVDHELIDKE